MTKQYSARAIHFFIALIVLLLDRWSKHLVSLHIPLYTHIQIVPGFFRLTHTENTGAAFSLFADSPAHWKTGMLIAFSLVALVIVFALLWTNARAPFWAELWEISGIVWPTNEWWIISCYMSGSINGQCSTSPTAQLWLVLGCW